MYRRINIFAILSLLCDESVLPRRILCCSRGVDSQSFCEFLVRLIWRDFCQVNKMKVALFGDYFDHLSLCGGLLPLQWVLKPKPCRAYCAIWRVSCKYVTVLFRVVPAHLYRDHILFSAWRAICRRRDCGQCDLYAYRQYREYREVLKLCRLNEVLLRDTFIFTARQQYSLLC